MNASPADGASTALPGPARGRWHRVRTFERVRTDDVPPAAPSPRGPSATPVYDQLVAEYTARNLTVPRVPDPRSPGRGWGAP
jgi:hypothetical protein